MNKVVSKLKALFFWSALFTFHLSAAQTVDTLHVLSYNVLYIGDTPPCQGPHTTWEGYIKRIIAYANPDIAGFVKMDAEDVNGSAPAGFADSLLQFSFNAAFAGKYNYCPFTNTSAADNISVLYYNQQKLGYAGMLCSYANITDFDTYKLFYKSTDLATTHDTIFIYVTLNHTNSGSGTSDATERGEQLSGEMAQIATHFTRLPNMINMGDFNVHNSSEPAYQTLVAPANLNYRYYDPPFYPDAVYTYPADWDDNPSDYAASLTVSTREESGHPNDCSGDTGGGKSWYDHIFLSAGIINNDDRIGYSANSFKVIGNDGNRLGISVNSAPVNTAVPADVADDIYEISEHYPITADLLVNKTANAIASIKNASAAITVVNPVSGQLIIQSSAAIPGNAIQLTAADVLGRIQMEETVPLINNCAQIPCTLLPGVYYLKFTAGGEVIGQMGILKNN